MLIISTEIWLHEDCLSRFYAKIPHFYIRNLQYIVCKWMDKIIMDQSGIQTWAHESLAKCSVPTEQSGASDQTCLSVTFLPCPVYDIFYISTVFPLAGVNLSVLGVNWHSTKCNRIWEK